LVERKHAEIRTEKCRRLEAREMRRRRHGKLKAAKEDAMNLKL